VRIWDMFFKSKELSNKGFHCAFVIVLINLLFLRLLLDFGQASYGVAIANGT
jgi:hypothetical protein